jgi:rod shape-determining protein MreC
MHRILNIITEFKEYFVLILLILISLILLALNDNSQIKQIRSYTVGLIGVAQSTLTLFPNIFNLQQENEILRQLDVTLSDEVSRLREAKIENAQLRRMLNFKEKNSFKLVSADVIGKSLHLLRNTITLNVGTSDSVNVNMPIITEQGIVGRVIATSANYSIGQILYNKDFRTSVKIQRSRVDGILAWDGENYLLIKNISKKQDVKVGDLVLSSEYSKIFPSNFKVGLVTKVTENPISLFKDITIDPSVDFTKLEQVFVIQALPDTQRVNLENKSIVRKR